jgi:hypothetical protein
VHYVVGLPHSATAPAPSRPNQTLSFLATPDFTTPSPALHCSS